MSLQLVAHFCHSFISCVERFLYNWDSLKMVFEEEMKEPKSSFAKAKAVQIMDFLKSPTNRLFALFLNYAARLFNPILVGLQAEEPLIQELKPAMDALLRDLLTKYVKSSEIIGKELTKVNL